MPLQATSGAASYDAFGGGVPVVPAYIEDVFATWLYDGNGSTQTIVNGVDLSTKGGLVWSKKRNSATQGDHLLVDTVRGTNPALISNSTAAQDNYGALSAFNSNGYTLNSDPFVNGSGNTYVGWTFRKQPKFFDIVTYSGNSTAGREIPHSLGSAPGCIIVKRTDSADGWQTYHRSLGSGYYVRLNETAASAPTSSYWNSTDPTSTVFTLGDAGGTNANGGTYIAYVFAHDAGGFGLTGTDNVISCGSYTGSSTVDVDVNLGYEPQFVMIKNITTGSTDWYIADIMRGMALTGIQPLLAPNLSDAESGFSGTYFTPTATGMKVQYGSGTAICSAGNTYIYIAIRRGPMKVPTDGAKVLQALTYTGNGSAGRVFSGVTTVPDLAIATSRSNISPKNWCDRLRGENPMISTSTAGENGTSQEGKTIIAGSANGTVTFGAYWGDAAVNANGYTYVNYLLSRAPSFFDEVCTTADGSGDVSFTHNLGVAPDLVIIKSRSSAGFDWWLYSSQVASPLSTYGRLNANGAFGGTAPTIYFDVTSTTFQTFTGGWTGNNSATVAYLFATCAGVSKCGSYTGTGTTLQIDCGFTSGARFVLIRRTNIGSSDWYVWDSARGIVSGNDPYLLLNSTAAEVTSTDYIDTYSAGFEISSTAPAAINGSGDSFIFLAIA